VKYVIEKELRNYASVTHLSTNELWQMDLYGVILPKWTSTGIEQAATDLARDKLQLVLKHHCFWMSKIKDYIK